MKKFILISATVLFSHTTFAQDLAYIRSLYMNEYTTYKYTPRELNFNVHGRYMRAVKEEKLNEANRLGDFIPGYPVNWVGNYVSVEILATCNGKDMKAMSLNDVLNANQKKILKTVDVGTNITVNVMYKSRNTVTDEIVNSIVYISMMVLPETQAEYAGGYQQLTKYLKENAISKIPETYQSGRQPMLKEFQQGIVFFTVDEDGEIIDAKITQSCGSLKTDLLLLDAINKMPKWKPAIDSKGKKVKQEFEFSVGNGGC